MKLANLASLDPAHRARGIKGLSSHSKADEAIWAEFLRDWEQMNLRSETRVCNEAVFKPAGGFLP